MDKITDKDKDKSKDKSKDQSKDKSKDKSKRTHGMSSRNQEWPVNKKYLKNKRKEPSLLRQSYSGIKTDKSI